MHDNRTLIENRLTRVLNERLKRAVHRPVAELEIRAWAIDGGQGEPVSPSVALRADYLPAKVGDRWGPAWGTTWLHLTGRVPQEATGRAVELVVDLGWADDLPGFQAEGLVYRPDGSVIKGLNPRNTWIPVATRAAGNETIDLYVEAAANPLVLDVQPFRPTALGEKTTAGDVPLYRLARADISVFETEVWELIQDLEVLDGVMRGLPDTDARRWEILYAIERALDQIDLADVADTATAARQQLSEALARPAASAAHRITAVGHAHIDSAWLWPVRETVRKVARTASNVLQLLDTHADLVFAMSSAQQYEWIAEDRPEVFAKVAEQVKGGRFVPVGGMWVESDTNMVGGEAMVRQFVYGKRYFLDNFGVECREVWLPDSFGYSAALPQIVKLAGCRWFLTQKISWNQVNRFPHHTFYWEGIDGTRIFTHFPPVDTYNSDLSGRELAHAAANFREKGAATVSLAPFGWGDGGGGPTREMIARARRTANLEGSPRVTMQTPAEFFAAAEAEYPNAPVWAGELYLELHRGTYTSQAKTKQGNRRSEHLLREAELWSATAAVRGVLDYPREALDRIWKTVLLQQFHDILPGSSIAWVHREASQNYARVALELEGIIDSAITALAGHGQEPLMFNASPFPRQGVTAAGAGSPETIQPPASAVPDGSDVLLDNGLLRVRVDVRGLITSIMDLTADREVLPPGTTANLLQLHPDFPNMWDAWDIDEFYRNSVRDLTELDDLAVIIDADSASIQVSRTFGQSRVLQRMTLAAGARQVDCEAEIDWHERDTLLKVAWPVDVHTDHAEFETQFGHVVRPTHQNTSWEAARFEVCAHRWVRVTEPGYGVAVVNDSSYGHDVTRVAHPDRATYSIVRLSLLRGPRFPDPETDQGSHRLRYALVAGAGVMEAARAGYEINLPIRVVDGAGAVPPLVGVDGDAVVESIKLADDRSGDVVVRLYEPLGGRGTATVRPSFPTARVDETDLLERPIEPDALVESASDGAIRFRLRPFQIVTLRLKPAR